MKTNLTLITSLILGACSVGGCASAGRLTEETTREVAVRQTEISGKWECAELAIPVWAISTKMHVVGKPEPQHDDTAFFWRCNKTIIGTPDAAMLGQLLKHDAVIADDPVTPTPAALIADLSRRGWELVSVIENTTHRTYIFKRPIAG